MKIETLFKTKWLALRRVFLDDPEVQYDFVHATHSNGEAVAILPYRLEEGRVEYLLRKELVPPWSLELSPCGVTGSMESGYTPLQMAVVELKEETGYTVGEELMEYRGMVRNSKASTTQIYLFTVDLTGLEAGESSGDGSALEEISSSYWTTDVFECEDAIIHAAYAKLLVSSPL